MNSPQLELRFKGWPWEGQNPRALTRAGKRFSFIRKGTGRSNPGTTRVPEVVQLELFPEGTSYGP